MSASQFAAGGPPAPAAEPGGSALALEALLRDLVRCLAGQVVRVAVAHAASADFTARPVGAGFELLLAPAGEASAERRLLACVAGELEVIEYCGAFVALYLDEGDGDSPGGFVQRVGAQYLRERIHCDPAGRAALFRRSWQTARRRRAAPEPACS